MHFGVACGPVSNYGGQKVSRNEEAMLAGFRSAKAPPQETLPEGVGFEVAREDPHGDGKTWIALFRKDSGGEEMFAEMVCDVAGTMDAVAGSGEDAVLRAMLSRIRAWQGIHEANSARAFARSGGRLGR